MAENKINVENLENVAGGNDGMRYGSWRDVCASVATGYLALRNYPSYDERNEIAAIQNGDIIEIDINNRFINVELSDEEIEKRLKEVKHPESDVSGWLALYQKLVHSADTGAIFKVVLKWKY